MAERRDRTGEHGRPGRSPRSQGWRVRAEQAYGELASDPSWTLTASEIGAYAFCFAPMMAGPSRAVFSTLRNGAS
jgi:hypothetical protein